MEKNSFLPVSAQEMQARGWDYVDIVLVSGDAYIDHPSFGAAVIGRYLEAEGFRVAILAQPDWNSCKPWRTFGKPRLFFGITAGNVDSMINHYTANKKIRSDDSYSPGGKAGLRPNRATLVYAFRAKEAYPGVTVVLGGVEASMRRLAHFDYWSETVKRSVIIDSKADLLVYGMGEKNTAAVARRLAAGEDIRQIRDLRGTVYALGASEKNLVPADALSIPSYEEITADKDKFLKASRMMLEESNPFNARAIVQVHDNRAVVQNPPQMPLSTAEMDRIYGLPFTRLPHPSYKEPVPAYEMIKDSITIHRGCFGGCSFCSLTMHQGRIIQPRSEESILAEVRKLAAHTRVISDLGAPSANMYGLGCSSPEISAKCRKHSCLFPAVCPNLKTDCARLLLLLKRAREQAGIKKITISSGIRMDLALRCPAYIRDIAQYHTGGHLSVAPEHSVPDVLAQMYKPPKETFVKFQDAFLEESKKCGKEQYIVPYFISGFPGSDIKSMAELAVFLKDLGYRPLQINDFIPAPMEPATAVYYTGKDLFSGKEVYVPRGERERKLQRALLQYFKPENKALVVKALSEIGRKDLIARLFSRETKNQGTYDTGQRKRDHRPGKPFHRFGRGRRPGH